jgi:hypothetical protein
MDPVNRPFRAGVGFMAKSLKRTRELLSREDLIGFDTSEWAGAAKVGGKVGAKIGTKGGIKART